MTSPPRVGARLEEVKPPAGRPPIDFAVLAGLVAVSLAVHLWLFTHTYTTARDSIGFAQLALQYESPALAVVRFPCRSAADVLRYGEPPHPPGYPMVVLAVSKVKIGRASCRERVCSTV